MTDFVTITPKTDASHAMQFTGGETNAAAIASWVDAELAAVSRRGAVALTYVPAAEEVVVDEVVEQAASPEFIGLFTFNGKFNVEPGGWIVVAPTTGVVRTFSSAAFDATFNILGGE